MSAVKKQAYAGIEVTLTCTAKDGFSVVEKFVFDKQSFEAYKELTPSEYFAEEIEKLAYMVYGHVFVQIDFDKAMMFSTSQGVNPFSRCVPKENSVHELLMDLIELKG